MDDVGKAFCDRLQKEKVRMMSFSTLSLHASFLEENSREFFLRGNLVDKI